MLDLELNHWRTMRLWIGTDLGGEREESLLCWQESSRSDVLWNLATVSVAFSLSCFPVVTDVAGP
jgi:hypothetical protein